MDAVVSFQAASRRQNLVLVVALLGWVFDGFEMGLFPLVARSSLIDLMGATQDAQIGLWIGRITAIFLIGAALGGAIFGWLGDRIGRVRSLALCVLTYSLFTGLCFFATSPWHLAGLRFLSALGMGGEWSLGVALVVETWPSDRRVFVAGLIGAGSNFGFLMVALMGSMFLITPDSWRWFMVAGALPALLTFVIRHYVPESEKWERCERVKKPLTLVFSRVYRRSTLIGISLSSVVLVGFWGAVHWAPIWVDKLTDGQIPAAKALVQMGYALGATFGGFLGAYAGYYWGRRRAYATLCVLSFIACSTLFLGLSEFNYWFFITMLAVGSTTGAFFGWLALYLPELFPTAIRATGQGVAFNFGRIIAAVGVLLTGTLVQLFDGDYARAGAVTSIVYLLGLIAVWFAPSTDEKMLPD